MVLAGEVDYGLMCREWPIVCRHREGQEIESCAVQALNLVVKCHCRDSNSNIGNSNLGGIVTDARGKKLSAAPGGQTGIVLGSRLPPIAIDAVANF